MKCKRCGSEDVSVTSMSSVMRVIFVILGLGTLLGSQLNIILVIIGLGCIACGFSSQKTVECKTCRTKY